MPFTIPATSDANIELSLFSIPATSDANIEFDPVAGSLPITIQDATQAVTADSPTLTQKFTAVIADATQAVTADSPTLTQKFAITIADATQATAAESPTLTQKFTLVIADVTQAVTAESPELTFTPGVFPPDETGWARGGEYFRHLQKRYEDELDDEEILSVMYA